MRRLMWGVTALLVAAVACEDSGVLVVGDPPAAPRNINGWYYARAVYVTWDLAPGWNGESFRVYSRRTTDSDYFLIADVTNCASGLCSYTDTNIVPGVTYEYYVSAWDPDTGLETASEFFVEVFVPQPVPPAVPGGMEVIALDGAAYLRWDDRARDAEDFAFYRIYLAGDDGSDFLLGETDSEGFLDELAQNGLTYAYFVSSVDDQGHESSGSSVAEATPRPDFHSEWVWDYFDRPELSGFRFQVDETTDPIVDGDSPFRHVRLETDAAGWWLVPGPDTRIHPDAFVTTALKCGVAADAACASLDQAPTSGYEAFDVALFPQTTYVMRVRGDDGAMRYAALRVTLLGFDQNDDAIMIFDWAYQLQPGNPNLAPRADVPVRIR